MAPLLILSAALLFYVGLLVYAFRKARRPVSDFKLLGESVRCPIEGCDQNHSKGDRR